MYKVIFCITFAILILSSCAAVEAPQEVEEESVVAATEVVDESWFLVAEEGYLNLYHINDKKRLKNSEPVDMSVFPLSDVAELEKGIKFDTVSDAYTVMEGFIN